MLPDQVRGQIKGLEKYHQQEESAVTPYHYTTVQSHHIQTPTKVAVKYKKCELATQTLNKTAKGVLSDKVPRLYQSINQSINQSIGMCRMR
jgi:hypothetical protein